MRLPSTCVAEPTDAEWAELWASDARATAFQHPAFARSWARHFGGGPIVLAHARSADGTLRALLALTAWDRPQGRVWVPLGAGQADYSDALGGAPDLDGLGEPVLVPDLRADAPIAAGVTGWCAAVEPGEVAPVLELPAALPYNLRRNVTKARNRAAAAGGVVVGLAAVDEIGEAVDALSRLAAGRRAADDGSILSDPRAPAWLADMAQAMAEAGLLRFVLVRHAGAIVAALLALADRRRMIAYLLGVDDRMPGQSLGTLAFAHVLERAEAEGLAELHFGRGDETWKRAWGAEPRRTVRLWLTPSTPCTESG